MSILLQPLNNVSHNSYNTLHTCQATRSSVEFSLVMTSSIVGAAVGAVQHRGEEG